MVTSSATVSPTHKLGFDPTYIDPFEKKVFIEGADTTRRLVSFFVLLLLATVIATYGVLADSTATVIGAMIVAPLMGPILAITVAVVMGSPRRALNSLLLVISGVAAVIALSAILTSLVPDFTISFSQNNEISSRISPGLYALLTALGAGAAGAFITSRAEIADSMGGVAIAISLVPPLCVVGISVSQGEWVAAGGAMLLFLTNFFAILLTGGITFMLVGLGKLAFVRQGTKLMRRTFILISVCTLLVAIPLSLSAYNSITHIGLTNKATVVTNQWLEGTSSNLVKLFINDQQVSIIIEGNGELKSTQLLADALGIALKFPVTIQLTNFQSTNEVIQSQIAP